MSKKYTVYGLADPRQPEVIRYVGATSQCLCGRLRQHCTPAKKDKSDRAKWVLELLKDGVQPIIIQLEECSARESKTIESKWIGNFRLCNSTAGGNLNGAAPVFKVGNFYLKDRLRKWRGELAQKQAADILGVSLSTYQNWEYGVNVPGVFAMKELERRIAVKPKC